MSIIPAGMTAFRTHLLEFASLCAASIRRTFAAHLPLYVCALLFTAATAAITYAYKAPLTFEASVFFLVTVPKFMLVGAFIAGCIQFVRLARGGSRSPLGDFGSWAYSVLGSHDRPGNILHSVITITPLMVSFSALKEVVPVIQPFSWDPIFEHWDRVLGFGTMPWQLLQPVLGFPAVTIAIDIAYVAWFTVIFGVLVWQAFFARAGELRMQFLLAFAFAWFFAGNVLAVIFSSAGPCYYGFLHAPDPYAQQLIYLREVNEHWALAALEIQNRLWQSYTAATGANIGISAMPSMHVTAVVLTALVARRTSRWLGLMLTAYAAVIVIGSVHLAWHYAVDAIAGIGLAGLFWCVAGWITRAEFSAGWARSWRSAIAP